VLRLLRNNITLSYKSQSQLTIDYHLLKPIGKKKFIQMMEFNAWYGNRHALFGELIFGFTDYTFLRSKA
tara:strand:- start:84 stop:290 length:207 start_codon:yes stop_codon:yes gene_type:complete